MSLKDEDSRKPGFQWETVKFSAGNLRTIALKFQCSNQRRCIWFARLAYTGALLGNLRASNEILEYSHATVVMLYSD